MSMKIGFIGLGNMGAPMATNLAKAGHDVAGFDVAGTTAEGVRVADSLEAAVAGMDAVITMLPNGSILRQVAAQAIPHMAQGTLFIDCSTVDVESAKNTAQAAEDAGIMAVDAPVSGGIGGASGGTLTFMAGGSTQAFAKAKPLFDIMGQKAVHCGDAGAGQAAKICNNMILGISMIGVCEAFVLAEKLGLEHQTMFDIVSTASGQCWSLTSYCPVPGPVPASPANNGYKPGFSAQNMLKDLHLSQDAANGFGASTELGKAAMEMYESYVGGEGEKADVSGIVNMIRKK